MKKLNLSGKTFRNQSINQSINQSLKALALFVVLVVASSSADAQIKVDTNGKIGLGTDSPSESIELKGTKVKISFPSTTNHIDIFPYNDITPCIDPSSNGNGTLGYNYYWGNVRTLTISRTNETSLSDKKFKDNFRSIDNPLLIINQLNPVVFDFKPELYKDVKNDNERDKLTKLGKDNYGLIAQEVEKVIPSIVSYDSVLDAKVMSYSQIIPILIKAIQEQQVQIKNLESETSSLKSAAKEKSAAIDGTTPTASLDQNVPNPFSANTSIGIHLPATVSRATLYIYNMQGSQIKQIAVNERGDTSVIIEGSTLKAGIYYYSLIADDKEVDTKKMILTK